MIRDRLMSGCSGTAGRILRYAVGGGRRPLSRRVVRPLKKETHRVFQAIDARQSACCANLFVSCRRNRMFGGTLQMYLGEPEISPRLDNVHRFMAGVYLSTGLITCWAAVTISQQGTLVYLLALGVLLAGSGGSCPSARSGFPSLQQCGSAT